MNKLVDYFRQNISFIALLVLGGFVASFTPFFWTSENIVNIFSQAAIPMLLSLGLCFVIGSGQIDLSVGSITAIGALIFGVVSNITGSLMAATTAACCAGIICGSINGLLSTFIPSFIVTLASMASFRGAALFLRIQNQLI